MNPADRARLERILNLARKIELRWPAGDRRQNRDLSQDLIYQELKREIIAGADSPNLNRLAESATHFHDQVSLAHFYAFIIPFERLLNRSLRDDEFLVEEGDDANKIGTRVPLKLIVENLRSAFNVGALFRTAECLGVSEILLCGYTPDPTNEKTARTSMGTAEVVPWRRANRASHACEELRGEGYQILALETAATSKSLYDFDFDARPTAFVVGNERFGLEGETLQAVDAICRLPARGMKNSLNVGIAFGVAAFEWLRQFEGAR